MVGLTTDEVIEIILSMPDVAETVSPGCFNYHRGKRFMMREVRTGEKNLVGYVPRQPRASVFLFRVTWDDHDDLLEAPGSVFFKKPHYAGWPGLLADSSDLTLETAREAVERAWKACLLPAKWRKT